MVENPLAVQEIRVWSLGREDPLGKEVATLSSIFAWRIPWEEDTGRLQSMESQKFGHNWVTTHSGHSSRYKYKGFPLWFSGKEFACQCGTCRFDPCIRKIPWRRKWQPTPVFLPGESHGQRSLAAYSPWNRKESDMPECMGTGTQTV